MKARMYTETHRQLKVMTWEADGKGDGRSGSGTNSHASKPSFSKTVPLQRESLNQQTQWVADPFSFPFPHSHAV